MMFRNIDNDGHNGHQHQHVTQHNDAHKLTNESEFALVHKHDWLLPREEPLNGKNKEHTDSLQFTQLTYSYDLNRGTMKTFPTCTLDVF